MLDSRFEPAAPFTEAEISEIEKILGRGLPNDYCEFVNTYGGAFVGGLVDGDPNLPVLAFFGTEKNRRVSKARLNVSTLFGDEQNSKRPDHFEAINHPWEP